MSNLNRKISRIAQSIGLLVPALFASSVHSKEVWSCPVSVSVKMAEVVPQTGGEKSHDYTNNSIETAFSDRKIMLSGMSLFDGPPKDLAVLKPSDDYSQVPTVSKNKAHKGRKLVWNTQAVHPDGVWLSCEYAQGLFSVRKQLKTPGSSCAANILEKNHQIEGKSLQIQFECQ